MSELKKAPPVPFTGDSCQYRGWVTSLQHRLAPLALDALDVIDIMLAHTVKEPQRMIMTFKNANSANPDLALETI